MAQRSIVPLFIGTFLLRANSSLNTVVLGLLLAQIEVLSSYMHAHSIGSLQVGLLPVVFYVTELLLAPCMGSLSDRWGRRNFLIIGPFFGLMQASFLFFTPTINPLPYLLALQALAGISGAIITPVALGYLADFTTVDRGRRMRMMSFYELVTSGGIAVGTVAGGIAWDRLGRFTFVLLACSYLVICGCMALSPVINQIVDHERRSHILMRYWNVLRTPRLLIFIPAWLCLSALVGVWLSSQLTYLLSRPAHHPYQLLMGSMSGPGGGLRLSLVLGGHVLCFGLGLLFWAFFLNRIARLRLMLTSVVGVYLACIALFGINHRGVGNEVLLLVWIPILLAGIFAQTSFAPAALAYLADISENTVKDRGLVMGLYSVFLGLGQILGNGLGGIFANHFGFDGLIYLTAMLALIALVSLLWLFRKEKAFC